VKRRTENKGKTPARASNRPSDARRLIESQDTKERRRVLNLLLDIEEDPTLADISGECLQLWMEAVKAIHKHKKTDPIYPSLLTKKNNLEAEMRQRLRLSPHFIQQMERRIASSGGRPRHSVELVAFIVAEKNAGRAVKDIIQEAKSKFGTDLTVNACHAILRRHKPA